MTKYQVAEHQARHGFVTIDEAKGVPDSVWPKSTVVPHDRMNKTEREYGLILEAMMNRGEIVEYRFEGLTLRLADDCRYTPDFFIIVTLQPLLIRFVEIKGRKIWDDAKVKFRVAKEGNKWAEWEMHQKVTGSWQRIL